jgi:hypothetical protein
MLGSNAYLDENDLRIGDQISSELKRNIRASGFVLVVWSDNARKSAWVGKEIEYAIRSRVPIMPILFTDPAGHIGIEDAKGIDFRLDSGFESNFLTLANRVGLTQKYDLAGFRNEITELTSRYGWVRRFLDLEEMFHLCNAPGVPELAALDYLPRSGSAEAFELDSLCYALSQMAPTINLVEVYSNIFGYLTATLDVAFEAAKSVIEHCNKRRNNSPNVIDLYTSHDIFGLLVSVPFSAHKYICRVIELAEMDPPGACGWATYIARTTEDGSISADILARMLSLAGSNARNGWPADLLIEIGAHTQIAQAASAKLISFMYAGQFDGYEDHIITERPNLYLIAIEAFAERGQHEIAKTMAEKATRRFRDAILNPPSMNVTSSRATEQFCISLWWLHNAIKMAPTKTGSGLVWARQLEKALWDSDQYEVLYYFWNEPLKSLMHDFHNILRARIDSGLVLGRSGWIGFDTTELNAKLSRVFENFGFHRNLR